MFNTQAAIVRTASVASLAAAAVLVLSPAAAAQDTEEQKRAKARVLFLGPDEIGELQDTEDGQALWLEVKEAAAREGNNRLVDAVTLHLALLRGPYLGVELVDLNEPLRAHFGVPGGSGVLVSNVIEDSPAARAGLQAGDILTRFDGTDVPNSRRLGSLVRRGEAGDPAYLEIWRDGKVETLNTTLDERPQPQVQPGSRFFFRGREDLDGDGELDVFVGPEKVHEKIQEYFNGDEWKERHEHVQRFLDERRPDMQALEERLEAVKKRLEEVESRLEDRSSGEDN